MSYVDYDDDFIDSPNNNLTSRVTSALMSLSDGKWRNRRAIFATMTDIISKPEEFIKAIIYSSPDENSDISSNLKIELRSLYSEILKRSGTPLDEDIKKNYIDYVNETIKNKNTAKFLISLINT